MGSKLIKSLLLFVLMIYFIFLVIARAPASWGAWAVHKAVPSVWLTGVSGTIWEGRAGGGAVVLGEQGVPLENLRWKIRPWTLLGLTICAEVNAQLLNQPASGVFCQAPGGLLTAQDVQLSAPMAVVTQALDLSLAGSASIQLQTLRMDGERVESLEGNLSWRDARWHNSERWVSLGAFAAKLAANDQGGVHAQIFDLDGPFTIDLVGNFVLHQEPVIKGTVAASAQAPEQIRAALEFVGEPMDDGSFRVAWPPGT